MRDAPVTSTRQRIAHISGEIVLTALAVGGIVCIVLVGLAFFFNVTLIMFKTGSMGPTIPAGSVAMVREIPASEIKIGDVVTVDRADALPVTHRVTSVNAGPSAHERTITMRGDANETDDPVPYDVAAVRIVMGSLPGLATVIVWFSNPFVLGAITLGASSLVTWAFWPREPRVQREAGRRGRHSVGAAASVLLASTLAVPLALTAPTSASAVDHVVQGAYLTLTSVTDPGMAIMEPGETVHWQVGIAAAAPEPGVIAVSVSGTGSDELELSAVVVACSVRWVGGSCDGQSWPPTVLDPFPVDGVERELIRMPSDEQRWLLLSVTMPGTAQPSPGHSATHRVLAVGHGDSVVVGPDVVVAATGLDINIPLQLALLAVGGGLTLPMLVGWRRSRSVP
jgi:signal peptidase